MLFNYFNLIFEVPSKPLTNYGKSIVKKIKDLIKTLSTFFR